MTDTHPLGLLTPKQREAVELRLHGWTNWRIADRLGISTHSAKGRVERARARLGELEFKRDWLAQLEGQIAAMAAKE